MADRTDLGRVVLYLATDLGSSERDLDGFERKAKEVGAELGKMIDSLDGTKAKVQAETMIAAIQKVGGTTKLTTDELKTLGAEASGLITKFNAVGTSVPADLQKIADAGKAASKDVSTGFSGMLSAIGPIGGMLAGAFSVGAIVGFGREIFADADALMRMSDQTGIGVVALQQLKAVAVESGNDVEQLTSAVSQMQKRLGEGDTSAVAAVNRLGISLDTLKSQSPDQQFLSIARAIAQINDPMERTRTAMELFGKSGAAILPSLRADVDKIIESTSTMSEETVKKLDAAGDAWERFKNRVKVFAAEAIVSTDGEVDAMKRRIQKLQEIANGALPDTVGLELAVQPRINAPATVPGMPSAAVMEQSEFAAGVLAKKLAELAAEAKRLAAETKKAEDAQKRFLESVKSLTTETIGARRGFGVYGQLFAENTGRGEEFANVLEGLNEDGTLVSSTFRNFSEKLQDVGLKSGIAQKGIEQLRAGAKGVAESIAGVFQNLPKLLVSAFTGGGGLLGAMKAIGVQLADAIVTPMMNGLSKAAKTAVAVGAGGASAAGGALGGQGGSIAGGLAGTIGGAALGGTALGAAATAGSITAMVGLAAATAGVGLAAVGAYLVIKKLLADPEKKVNPVRQAFVDAAGGLDALNKRAVAAGATLDAMLNAKTPEQYNKAITDLTATINKHEAAVQRVSDSVSKLSEAWSAAGDDIPTDIKASIDQLRTMNGLTDDQKKLLDQMSAAAEPDYKKLTDLASQYGITLDALGPTFQQQNITGTAVDIFKAFDQITRAGGDVGGVLSGMADEISKLVDDSIKFGAEIPDNMKPLIENLAQAGKLTDDAGNAITDISQIKFGATPLDRSTSAIVDAVHELRDALLALPDNAAKAAQGVKDAFSGVDAKSLGGGGGGEKSRSSEVVPPSEGGNLVVTRPTLHFSRATDTKSGQAGRSGSGGSGLEVPVYLDGRLVARGILPHLYDQARLNGAVR